MSKHKKAQIKVIDAAGSPSSMGKTIGRSCGHIASMMIRGARARFATKGIGWSTAIATSQRYRPYCEEYDPDFMEWIEGYATGSGLSTDDLIVLLCDGEKGFCTDILANELVTEDGAALHAHTEDWREESEKYNIVLRGKPRNGASFLSVTHAGLELIGGVNSAGLSFCGNSVYPDDERVGLPKLFQGRRLATSRSISEAMESCLPHHRGSSYNVNLCHSSGEMYCVEGSATRHALLYAADGYLVHTNHYLDAAMRQREARFGTGDTSLIGSSSTIFRYHRALRLTEKALGCITKDHLKKTLSDHVNYPDSICSHPFKGTPREERSKTVFAAVFDTTHRTMDICAGNPCTGRFDEIRLGT